MILKQVNVSYLWKLPVFILFSCFSCDWFYQYLIDIIDHNNNRQCIARFSLITLVSSIFSFGIRFLIICCIVPTHSHFLCESFTGPSQSYRSSSSCAMPGGVRSHTPSQVLVLDIPKQLFCFLYWWLLEKFVMYTLQIFSVFVYFAVLNCNI